MKKRTSILEYLMHLGDEFMIALMIMVMCVILIYMSFKWEEHVDAVLTLIAGWMGAIITYYFVKNGNGGNK